MQMRIPTSTLLILLAIAPALRAAEQPGPLTLPEAVAIALEKNPAHKMFVADVNASNAGLALARSAFLPKLGFTEAVTVGDDPVYVFGALLRQGRFTQSDFALNSLNFPSPLSNYSSRVEGKWNVFDSFHNKFQFDRAHAMNRAAQKQLTRADQELIYRVVDAYYGALLAKRQLEVAEQSLKTAQAVVESSSSKVAAGTAVEADALAAKVMYATRQQDVIRAHGALEVARAQLETALGAPLAPGQQPADALEERFPPSVELEQAEVRALKLRPDLKAATEQLEAQRDSVKAAKAAFGPRLDVFGSWEADNPSFAHNGSSNWMTGAELHFDVFAREKNAQLGMEKAALSRADASHKMESDNIRLDVRRAYYQYDAARQMLEVARGAVAQAEETMRIVRDRYDSGLVTVTELLRAEDAESASRTNYWQSVYRNIISYSALQLATGELSEHSAAVTQ
jgi:outer membrane protein